MENGSSFFKWDWIIYFVLGYLIITLKLWEFIPFIPIYISAPLTVVILMVVYQLIKILLKRVFKK